MGDSDSHTFGDNSQVILGGENSGFGYNYHAAPDFGRRAAGLRAGVRRADLRAAGRTAHRRSRPQP